MAATISDTDETIDLDHGVKVHILRDDDPVDPRENHNLGVMACWHRKYTLGDTIVDPGSRHWNGKGYIGAGRRIPVHSDPGDMWASILDEGGLDPALLLPILRIAMEDTSIRSDHRRQVRGMSRPERRHHLPPFIRDLVVADGLCDRATNELQSALIAAGLVILPIFLYDHSGITIRTTSFNDRWDSGQVGFIYATGKAICENWNVASVDDPVFYPHDGSTKTARERAMDALEAEVEEYDQFLRGDVYGFVLETLDDDHADSCWGFFGVEYVREQAVEAAERFVKKYADMARTAGSDI